MNRIYIKYGKVIIMKYVKDVLQPIKNNKINNNYLVYSSMTKQLFIEHSILFKRDSVAILTKKRVNC